MATPRALFVALAVGLAWSAAADAAARRTIDTHGVPPEFEALTAPHQALVDVYFGSQKIGESQVEVRPGFVRLEDPAKILSLIPNVVPSPELASALAGELPSNTSRLCGEVGNSGCGSLAPEVVGLIFDEDHFRVDLFVNPKWLKTIGSDREQYLTRPGSALSLTNSTGVAVSGSAAASPQYSVQNRTILGFHNARIRSDTSIASDQGFIADSLVAEIDEPGLRYSGGLFWAPGLDLIGQRRILGVGAASQMETRVDRDSVSGTPLIVFLSQPSRVDLLVDGRLLSSHLYQAGNNLIDTSALSEGAYTVTLRVQEQNGTVHDEHRFFAKNPNIAPLGRTMLFGYAGWLANTRRGHAIAISHDIFYQAGVARRLTRSFALDLSVVGTQKKPLLEAGAWALSPRARLRVAALASPTGDFGALVQLASTQTGPLSFNFDLRRIWSKSGAALIPLPSYVDSFHPGTTDADELREGSYIQASGRVGMRFSQTYVALVGSYRKTGRIESDYNIGPAFRWDATVARGLQLAVQGDAELSRSSVAAYLGFSLLYSAGSFSVQTTGGARTTPERGGSRTEGVGSVSAQYSYNDNNDTSVSVTAGVDHDSALTAGHAAALVYSRFGSARGEIRKDFSGTNPLQYSLSIQTAAAVSGAGAIVGGKHLDDSALIVSVAGEGVDAEFDVLIDDQPRGRLKSGGRLPIFLPPYRAYKVRLKPVNAASVWFDTATRKVTVFPGNVANERWTVERIQTVFGRAVYSDGSPVANALLTARRGVSETDENGYFQVDVTSNEAVSFKTTGQGTCTVRLGKLTQPRDYSGIGEVVCR
jgi:hypothetical protein